MYADQITNSMQRAISETNRRRAEQIAYNEKTWYHTSVCQERSKRYYSRYHCR